MIIKQAQQILKIEQEAIKNLISRIDENFEKAIEILYNCKSRVIVIGLGKSGLIGRKIAATLSSTGTPALFLHAAEASHGDLGVITKDDCIIAISNSGETEEIIKLIPFFKIMGVKLISLTGKLNSTLAKESDVVLDVSVKKEACFLGLAPTSSIIATLAMGDTLAIVLLKKKNFKKEDFAFFHPGGSLGKHIFLKVKDVMRKNNEIPIIDENSEVKQVLFKMSYPYNFGVAIIVNKQKKMSGIFTDGDLRKILQKDDNVLSKKIKEIMNKSAKIIDENELAAKAISLMENYNITCLVVVDLKKIPIGLVRLHDLLKIGFLSNWQENEKSRNWREV
ncbi:MAG: KpsF/GutQ family sugar-phosphate isomerase [bacterium]